MQRVAGHVGDQHALNVNANVNLKAMAMAVQRGQPVLLQLRQVVMRDGALRMPGARRSVAGGQRPFDAGIAGIDQQIHGGDTPGGMAALSRSETSPDRISTRPASVSSSSRPSVS